MRKGLSRFVIFLWSTIILVIVVMIAFYFQDEIRKLANLNHGTPTPIKTISLPTLTTTQLPPTPTATIVPPTASPSPVPKTATPATPQPQIIGFSVTGRPLEVYQFGTGPIEKMIVAGIHGGYEYNTIILADELIQYLESHQEIIPPDHTLYILRALTQMVLSAPEDSEEELMKITSILTGISHPTGKSNGLGQGAGIIYQSLPVYLLHLNLKPRH